MELSGDQRQRAIRHAQECLAEADKQHTPEEMDVVELWYLSLGPSSPQTSLFAAPPNAGLITGGQSEPTGLADRSAVGQ